jgi:hypothetical protein
VIFPDPTGTRLLGSIEANRLVLLCGAGLSMPPPSSLMSAARVGEVCYDRYEPTKTLPAAMRGKIDELAGHFYSTGDIRELIHRPVGSVERLGRTTECWARRCRRFFN